MPSVQRGMLTQPHARQIVSQATSAAVCQAFGFLPPSMVSFPAPIQPREEGVLTSAPSVPVLKDLNALTEAEVIGFTSRDCNKRDVSLRRASIKSTLDD
jgi:hypothetical protein